MNIVRSTYVPSKAYNGYTLFTGMGGCGTWLIDMDGRFVHHWETQYPGTHAKLLPNGNLLYTGRMLPPTLKLGGINGILLEMDWEGNVVWEYKDGYMHHDFWRLPNGNTMVLRFVPVPEEMAAKVKGGIPGTEKDGVMWTDSFREVNRDGEVVWEWFAYEHLDPENDFICPLCARAEWTHSSSCHILPDGNILTVFSKQNVIAIIDKTSGAVTWKWGFEQLGHPHDPQLLENGNIILFDNGSHRRSSLLEPRFQDSFISFSRIVEVNPRTDEVVWEYVDESFMHFNAPFISGCQRLPNGNTLVCDGPTGRLFEITKEKEVVWEYSSPLFNSGLKPVLGLANAIFRAYRFGPDDPALQGRELNPDHVELVLRRSPLAGGR